MSTFILYIGYILDKQGKKKPPTQEVIDEVIVRHRTEQDAVVTKQTDEELPGGFRIIREDDTLQGILKRDDTMTLDYRTVMDKARHAKILKDGAKYSGDQTYHGAKPYGT